MTAAAPAVGEQLRTVPLPGGRRLTIRWEEPDDAASIVCLYDRLSEDELYCRFFTARRPPDTFIERMTHVRERGGLGIVAVVSDRLGRDRIVAEASYELLPNGDGELGIAVEGSSRGWLGPYLLDTLIQLAAERGVPNLESEVLVSNRRMLAVLRSRGLVILEYYDSPATLRVAVAAAAAIPAWPGAHDRPRLLVELPGGQWHLAPAMQRSGFQVLTCPGPDRGGPRCNAISGHSCPLAAGADVIVDAQPGDLGRVLVHAHRRLHPSVPACVARFSDSEPPDPDTPILKGDDEAAVAEFLNDLAGRQGR